MNHSHLPEGLNLLTGEVADYAARLDVHWEQWARRLGAVVFRPPACIPRAVLERCDYLEKFPHLATFLAPDHNDEDSCLLNPAACYHVYPAFEGASLAGPTVVTLSAPCFRREAHFARFERQWGFTMREIVCLGRPSEVSAFLDAAADGVRRLSAALGITGRFEDASDPFFAASDAQATSGLMQRLARLKREWVVRSPEGCAIASVNCHQRFFTDRFEISRDGEVAFSGCLAFGLERWLLALRETHGVAAGNWPRPEDISWAA